MLPPPLPIVDAVKNKKMVKNNIKTVDENILIFDEDKFLKMFLLENNNTNNNKENQSLKIQFRIFEILFKIIDLKSKIILINLKHFLKNLYSISNEKCLLYNPEDKNNITNAITEKIYFNEATCEFNVNMYQNDFFSNEVIEKLINLNINCFENYNSNNNNNNNNNKKSHEVLEIFRKLFGLFIKEYNEAFHVFEDNNNSNNSSNNYNNEVSTASADFTVNFSASNKNMKRKLKKDKDDLNKLQNKTKKRKPKKIIETSDDSNDDDDYEDEKNVKKISNKKVKKN
jgi:hypothetical protein